MVMILWASPNDDGLTAACARAAQSGVERAGGECRLVKLNDSNVNACKACGNGWGTCRGEHFCQVEDGFQALHAELKKADAVIAVTPVYWGEMAEVAKNFFDRLRRCEGLHRDDSAFTGKYLLAVAAAGGSGNGTQTCLAQFERLSQHLGMKMFDLVPMKRLTRGYQLETITNAAAALQQSLRG